jgi:hypothetical protein
MVATLVLENYVLNRKRVDRVQREIDDRNVTELINDVIMILC